MAARQMAILETVTRDGEASVTALAEALSVSQVTIRKDLDTLEEQGLVRRERGIATPVSSDDPAGRIAHHYAAKLRIAQAAAGSVSEGETVMMAPASGFYTTPGAGRNQVRIAYVLKREDLQRALVVLKKALEAYPGRVEEE